MALQAITWNGLANSNRCTLCVLGHPSRPLFFFSNFPYPYSYCCCSILASVASSLSRCQVCRCVFIFTLRCFNCNFRPAEFKKKTISNCDSIFYWCCMAIMVCQRCRMVTSIYILTRNNILFGKSPFNSL